MKRLATLVLAAGFAVSLLFSTGQGAFATPFSDVPANHWAYQALQSLAADGLVEGYPDGKFKGDRPLSRYEMAVLTARVIAKVEANGASKADLDKLQKLIDALKDELDALGVRVTNLEDALDALDKRTQLAQKLEFHGVFQPNASFRQRTTVPHTISGSAGLDPFTSTFLFTDDSNNPLSSSGSGIRLRSENRWTLTYHINENIDISIPMHMITYNFGGEYDATSTSNTHLSLDPSVLVKVAKAGSFTNLQFKYGVLDDMKPSRLGLAFNPPAGYDRPGVYFGFSNPLQPYQKGMSVAGTLLGLTDFRFSFSRVDPVAIDTSTNILDPNCQCDNNTGGYLNAVVAPQVGYNQTVPAGTLRSNTFNAGSGPLSQVYLTFKAVNGTVFVSSYNGATYSSNGTLVAGPPGSPATAPAFTYNDAYNAVIFGTPLGAGSSVTISYTGLASTGNTQWQRYMVNGRINQRIKGWKGAEIGVTFNRIFDYDDLVVQSNITAPIVNQAAAQGYGLVSDTVFGIDFQLPIPYEISGKGSYPILFGEAAGSKYTADYRNVPATSDTAGVIGLRLKIQSADISFTYQSIGANFIDGAPLRYFGNAPALFSYWKLPYFPNFYGFANPLGINAQLDNAFTAVGKASPNTAGNAALTFIYPVFNQFQGGGQFFYQNPAYMPNTRGPSLNVTTPIKVGDTTFNGRLTARHLEEIRPNSFGQVVYGPGGASSVREQYDTITGGVGVSIPAFGQKIALDVSGGYERLYRNDTTPSAYLPINPATGSIDPTVAVAAAGAFGINPATGAPNSPVSFYPNYVNDKKYIFAVSASVPITRDVVVSGTYNTQRWGGQYGTTLTQNISERKDWYVGSLTYNIPKTTSSVQFQAKQYKYVDDVIPAFNTVMNRQDINFTVRF